MTRLGINSNDKRHVKQVLTFRRSVLRNIGHEVPFNVTYAYPVSLISARNRRFARLPTE